MQCDIIIKICLLNLIKNKPWCNLVNNKIKLAMQKIIAVILIVILSLDNQVKASLGVDLSVAFNNFSCLKG